MSVILSEHNPRFVILSRRRRIPFRITGYYLFEILRLRLRMTAAVARSDSGGCGIMHRKRNTIPPSSEIFVTYLKNN